VFVFFQKHLIAAHFLLVIQIIAILSDVIGLEQCLSSKRKLTSIFIWWISRARHWLVPSHMWLRGKRSL